MDEAFTADKVVATFASTADNAVAEAASTADEASMTDKAAAILASTANEGMAEVVSTADEASTRCTRLCDPICVHNRRDPQEMQPPQQQKLLLQEMLSMKKQTARGHELRHVGIATERITVGPDIPRLTFLSTQNQYFSEQLCDEEYS